MAADHALADGSEKEAASKIDLLHESAGSFNAISDALGEIDESIERIAEFGERSVVVATRKMQKRLRRTAPSVTMIGQVKSGKTTLVNAMIGEPNLLPSDVNPWTSVVTSIHLQTERTPDSGKASFRFFSEDEWDKLTTRGGRLGELAGRAGADDELARVAEQLSAMREKSKRRLGSQFELMMGQEHRYSDFDPELVQRYVCLGDDFETDTDTSSTQGRFADITKSADLYLHRPEYPMDLCIRDTPGVNDTFMMREQITIRAIRESRTCVVVLSAHQAMNSVDLALVRLIANIPSRDIIIFVNRIDELSDPETQIDEIRNSIRETLISHKGPKNPEILFGSAYWASHALSGDLEQMSPASVETLVRWAEANDMYWPEGDDESAANRIIWEASGVPKLLAALSERLEQSVAREITDGVARTALNLANSLETTLQTVSPPAGDSKVVPLNKQSIPGELDRIEKRAIEELSEQFAKLIPDFHRRLDHAHRGFVDRATGALIAHLEKHGESKAWTYDPTGLRILLRSAFQVFTGKARKAMQKAFETTADEVRNLYFHSFDLQGTDFWIEPPAPPLIPPPVTLGRTIALDLNSGWWTRWWHKRRGYQAYASDFSELILAETLRIVQDMKDDYGTPTQEAAEAVIREFLTSQRNVLIDLASRAEVESEEFAQLGFDDERRRKAEALRQAKSVLARHINQNTTEQS